MKIIEVETENIADITSIVSILNGFTPEANADFIKDSQAYSEKINNKDKQGKKKKKKEKEDDENVEIEEVENKGELKILTADPNQVMITFISLKGSSFKKFKVLPDKYSIGLNLDELSKYLKNVDKEGTMSIHVDSDDTQHVIFKVQNENNPSVSICELRVLNLSSRKDRKIEASVAMAIRINCAKFHKVCKDLYQFSPYVEITCDPTKLVITCKGDLSNHSRIFKADGSSNGISIKTIKQNNEEEEKDTPNIIRLIFDLKYINTMYKCSSLCDDMEIYLNTDSVMFLKYGIKLMGEMLVGIAPSGKKKDVAENYDEDDDMYYDDEEILLK
jgi:proliferating cell nuclear antigen PCNA